GGDLDALRAVAAEHHRAGGAPGDGGDLDDAAQMGGGGVEVLGLEQGRQLGLVGEDDVGRGLDEGQQFGAPAVDDEGVGQGDGDLAPGGVGGGGGGLEGGAGRGRVEQIAFQIDDGRGADDGGVDVGGRQLVGGAEEGAHGALAVGGDVDHAHAGGAVGQRPGGEMDADGVDVVGEDPAQLVVGDLADIGRASAEAADPGHGVAGRAARGLDPGG